MPHRSLFNSILSVKGSVPGRFLARATLILKGIIEVPASGATFSKSFDKPPFVVIIFENGLAPITPVYRLIDRAWIFDPNLASHKAEDGFRSALVKSKVATLGPFDSHKVEVSHSVYVSRPKEVAVLIEDAASHAMKKK